MVGVIEIVWSWFINKVLDRMVSIFSKNKKTEVENKKILEIIKNLEEKNIQLRKELERKNKKIKKERQSKIKVISEYERLFRALKRRGLSKDILIQKYRQPIEALLISISDQKIKKDGRWVKAKEEQKYVRNILEKQFGAKRIGAAFWIIPPTKLTKNFRNRDDLKNFFESIYNQYKDEHTLKLNILAKVDLRDCFWKNYLPFPQTHPRYKTIGEILEINDIFTDKELAKAFVDNNVSVAEPILNGDIAFFASKVLSDKELDIIHKNQMDIEKKLGNPNLRVLSKEEMIPKIANVLAQYGIKYSEEIAKEIVKEAKSWYDKLK